MQAQLPLFSAVAPAPSPPAVEVVAAPPSLDESPAVVEAVEVSAPTPPDPEAFVLVAGRTADGEPTLAVQRAEAEAPTPSSAPRYGNSLPPVVGLPAEDQRIIDALGGLIGHEYPITIGLDVIHKVVATIQRAIRAHFGEKCGKKRVGPDPLDQLGDDLAHVLAPPPPPNPPPPRSSGNVARPSRQPRRSPTDDLEDPATIAEQIESNLHQAMVEITGLSADLATGGATPAARPAWVVFVAPKPVDLTALPMPALTHATGRYAAESEVGLAMGVPLSRCFALPAWDALLVGAVPLAEHPLRRSEPADVCEALMAVMQRQIERADEEIAETTATHASLLGLTVPELEEKLTGEHAAAAKEKAERKVEEKARRLPAPKNAPVRKAKAPGEGASVADGLRRLTERQVELLRLVEVDQRTNRVVYTRDDRIPDWSSLKQAVEALGGVYRTAGKKTKGGWVFSEDVDAMDAIATALEMGAIFDPRLLGFFATSDALADELVARLNLRPGDRVLEPSAGKAALALAARRACPEVEIVCVELVPEHQEALRAHGFKVIGGDFLQQDLASLGGPFTVCLANPPFGRGRPEIHHLRHMLSLLDTGARLGAIMPSSLVFRDDAATSSLRAELDRHGVVITKNAADAFRASGAMVSTVSLSLTMT
jgi:predicted RNA methylase